MSQMRGRVEALLRRKWRQGKQRKSDPSYSWGVAGNFRLKLRGPENEIEEREGGGSSDLIMFRRGQLPPLAIM